MPNLIHSSDSSSLILLVYDLFNRSNLYIYTIHDCFAVAATNMDAVMKNLISVHIHLYSRRGLLDKFHKKFKSTLKSILDEGLEEKNFLVNI